MLQRLVDDDVLVLTLDRPEKRNALDVALCRAVGEALTSAAGDSPSRAVVITGSGSTFCAGADLDGVYGDEFLEAHYGMLGAITGSPIPVIAAVNGPAIGGGTQLAAACDLRVGSPAARFAVPTARNGLAVDPWTIRRLSDLVGGGHARGILLAAESLDLPAAIACGLVQRAGDLTDAIALAHDLAALAPLSLSYAKHVLNSPQLPDDDPGLRAEFLACFASDDAAEAESARREGRRPVFRGR
ncbi:enoyl-CoA hydratase [Intrasporangium sp.]|uniref:enoyl-CoA hydratase n=1 Tax=Intrasporangium sp. TaxID=1925024 RepID=UPI002939DCCB|nr:enoyl-CoA hydratase [Intrasporangium sp.]MDV3221534.1 enoyl-CoA hydratase [Intrasporangium sp.]